MRGRQAIPVCDPSPVTGPPSQVAVAVPRGCTLQPNEERAPKIRTPWSAPFRRFGSWLEGSGIANMGGPARKSDVWHLRCARQVRNYTRKWKTMEGLIVRLVSQSAAKLPGEDQLLDNWPACRPCPFRAVHRIKPCTHAHRYTHSE